MVTNQGFSREFTAAAGLVGATVTAQVDLPAAAAYIVEHAGGRLLPPVGTSLKRAGLAALLHSSGAILEDTVNRATASAVAAGVTGANFGLAATGTVVLDSTPEPVRLATTLPEQHFVLLDPAKIIADDFAAIPHLREFHRRQPRNYMAYITGPSRTADIERVLTIGVHGPRELHILLVPALSDDFLEL